MSVPATEVLFNWAHDSFIVGHLLGIQITNYVDLEESLVIGSYSQDHLGHAGVLLELAGIDRDDIDYYFYFLPHEQWRVTPLAAWRSGEWSDVVVKHLLYAALAAVRLRTLEGGPHEDHGRVLALENEQHGRHWANWWNILHRDPDQAARVDASLATALDRCGRLAAAGLPDDDGPAWEEELEPVLGDRARGRPAGIPSEADLTEIVDDLQSIVRADRDSHVWSVWKQA